MYFKKSRASQPARPPVEYTVEQIWGSAAYAYRINAGYFRDDVREFETNTVTKFSNKNLIWQQQAKDFADVTSEDLEVGAAALLWLKGQRMFGQLTGTAKPSEFGIALDTLVKQEKFSSRDRYYPAIAASQIKAYKEYLREQAMREDAERSPLADVGVKVEETVTVLRSVFSVKFNVYYVTAKTNSQHMVFFSHKAPLDPDGQYHIKGTVKAHRPDSTQLTRVKVV